MQAQNYLNVQKYETCKQKTKKWFFSKTWEGILTKIKWTDSEIKRKGRRGKYETIGNIEIVGVEGFYTKIAGTLET